MKKIKAILLDIGGVLLHVDWEQAIIENKNNLSIKQIVKQISDWNIFHDFEKGLISSEEFFKKISQEIKLEYNFDQFTTIFNSCFHGEIEGVEKLLKRLPSDIKLYTLSNTNPIHFNHFKDSPIFKQFDHLYTSFELKERKPDNEIYTTIIEKIKINAENCLFLDDLEENLEASRNYGINSHYCFNSSKIMEKIFTSYNLI